MVEEIKNATLAALGGDLFKMNMLGKGLLVDAGINTKNIIKIRMNDLSSCFHSFCGSSLLCKLSAPWSSTLSFCMSASQSGLCQQQGTQHNLYFSPSAPKWLYHNGRAKESAP
uniref:Uncharacterized protein n=1 Tax=Romanomermis culicivorax TaxID=13658 RepID=A0A915HMJ4_ROMCU